MLKFLQSFEDVDVSSPDVEVVVDADVDFPVDVAFVVDVSPNVEIVVAAPEFFSGEVVEISLLIDDEMCSLRSLSEDWCRRRFSFLLYGARTHILIELCSTFRVAARTHSHAPYWTGIAAARLARRHQHRYMYR